jgi:hypothetical protein
VALLVWSGNRRKMQVNALNYYSQTLRKLASFSAVYAKSSDENPLEPLAIL